MPVHLIEKSRQLIDVAQLEHDGEEIVGVVPNGTETVWIYTRRVRTELETR